MIQVTPEIAAGQFFDELIRADGEARPGADSLLKFLTDLSPEVLSEKRTALEAAIKSQGISFLVYLVLNLLCFFRMRWDVRF